MDSEKKDEDDIDLMKGGEYEGGTDDIETELQNNSSAFEALERDFQEVLSELLGDQSLEKFRLEYEKLHRALKKSHEQEKRLVKKCKELNSEILNNQAKIKTALRLSQEDQKTISHLQKEMEKTWKLVYMSQEKETRAKDTIGQLKEEMNNLSKLVERGAGLSLNQENMMKELRQAKDELQIQVEETAGQLQMTETQLMEQHKVQEELRSERDASNQNVQELRERVAAKEMDNIRECKRREKTQRELQEVRVQLDNMVKGEEFLNGEIAKGQGKVHELDRQLADAKATMDKYLRDYDTLFQRTQKVTSDLESQVTRNKETQNDFINLEKEMKLKHIELGRMKTEKDILERKLDKEHRAAIHWQQVAEEAKTPLQVAQTEIDSLKKELIAAHRQELQLQKTTDKVEKAKDVQMRMTEKAEGKVIEITSMKEEEERINQSLSEELTESKMEVQKLRKAIFQLEKDRERLGNEVTDQRNLYLSSQEDSRLREVQISELKKRVTEWEAKLKQQQQLYETVRADRNHYSKGLLEAQDEIAELRKKFKIMGHQIEQLKEEIATKDQALIKEHFELQRADKLKENVQNELNRKNLMITSNHELIDQQDNELKRLSVMIKRIDDESLAQKKEYDQVISERDILGTQLIRRNDELALLYEKLRVQQSALRAGESQYSARIEDIRVLRLKLKDFERDIKLLKSTGNQSEEKQREILYLQKELLHEKTKVTALSEELENPMNVHRWRKLEGSDPATFELIQKIQTLQKRLIAKTEEVVEKGLIIQEKEKVYTELSDVLARQPGPEVSEQLTVYQQNLKQKSRQMKAMASELNMYQAQVNEYKYDIERLNRELQELKRKYYQQKRKEQITSELGTDFMAQQQASSGGMPASKALGTNAAVLQQEQVIAAKSSRTRYTGGGFAIK